MLRFYSEDGRVFPCFVCKECGLPIRDADMAMACIDGDFRDPNGAPGFLLHKGDCDKAYGEKHGEVTRWHEFGIAIPKALANSRYVDHSRQFAIPAQSLDAEMCVLGAMLIDRESVEKATAILRPDDFYRCAHRVIFEAISALFERSQPIDLLTVREQLQHGGLFESIGGSSYLIQIQNSIPSTNALPIYLKQVRDAAESRRKMDGNTEAR